MQVGAPWVIAGLEAHAGAYGGRSLAVETGVTGVRAQALRPVGNARSVVDPQETVTKVSGHDGSPGVKLLPTKSGAVPS
jgi:hypothetical protein